MLDYRTHTFLEVYRQRSFTKAAEALLITQPAVSQHIRHLERHYGCALFVKQGRSATPTAAADVLYRRLSALENDELRIEREVLAIANTGRTGASPLRFGCTRTIADYVAPDLVVRLLRDRPETDVLMRSDNTRTLLNQIEAGELDFALVEGSFDRERFDWERISTEPYITVAAPGTPPAKSVGELLGNCLILREEGSGTREILEKHLAARGLGIDSFAGTLEIGSISTIKACAAAGAGISCMYRIAVEGELARGELSDITPPDLHIEHDFRIIWQHGSRYADRYRALAEGVCRIRTQEPTRSAAQLRKRA